MGLGENIKRVRLQKQWTQPALAERANISKGYIYMLESGEMSNPSLEMLFKIANALGTTIADLVGEAHIAVTSSQPEIPDSLVRFVKQRRRAGEPLTEDDILNLARTEFRGKRPNSVEDWAYVYQFFKRTFGERQ
jgi:transcriptional regulator with XRE-family HTH domain